MTNKDQVALSSIVKRPFSNMKKAFIEMFTQANYLACNSMYYANIFLKPL